MLGPRIKERLKAAGITQAELARRAKVPQTTMNGLINGPQRSTPHLVRIARILGTTEAYLSGDVDDPGEGAAPAPPAGPQVIMLGVVLPPERALARMFEVLLEGLDRKASVDTQAQQLAEQLPIAMSQLRDLLPDEVRTVRELATAAAAAPRRDRATQP